MKEEMRNIDELIVQYLSDEANKEDIDYLKRWLNEDKHNFEYYSQIKTAWLLSLEDKNPHGFNTEKAIFGFNERNVRGKKRIFAFLKYAAIFVIAFLLGGGLMYIVKPVDASEEDALSYLNEAEAPYGVRSKVNLPDGSQAWLNSGSKLYFPTVFEGNKREVKLIGEAYFEVQTNPNKPFVVNANGVIVKALGTSFNVKSYPDESFVEATLIEGKLQVSKENSGKSPINLKPNEKVIIYKNKEEIQFLGDNIPKQKKEMISEDVVLEKEVESKNDISWREGVWVIQDETLSTLARKLERRYNVKIRFMDASMSKFRYSGTIKDESIDKVLDVLTLTSPLIYEKRENNIITFDINKESKNKFKDELDLN